MGLCFFTEVPCEGRLPWLYFNAVVVAVVSSALPLGGCYLGSTQGCCDSHWVSQRLRACVRMGCDKQGFTLLQETIEEVEEMLNNLPGVTSVHSRFYDLSSKYYQTIGNHASYYKDALRFLGCIDVKDLPGNSSSAPRNVPGSMLLSHCSHLIPMYWQRTGFLGLSLELPWLGQDLAGRRSSSWEEELSGNLLLCRTEVVGGGSAPTRRASLF